MDDLEVALTEGPGGVGRRRGWVGISLVAVAAAAAVALIAGGVAFLAPASPPAARPAGDAARAAPVIPPGTQPVSFHGVDVFVPTAWKLNDTVCGTPIHDTVVLEDGSPVPACLISPPRTGLTVVRITAADTPMGRIRATVATVATTAVTVDGHAARRGTGTPAGEQTPLSVLVVHDPGVVVSVESPDTTAAQAILDRVRVADVDVYGCRARVSTLTPRSAETRPGTTGTLVPANPTGAVVCRYADNQLGFSTRLSPDATANLVSTLNGLPVGVSQPGPGTFEAAELCPEELRRGFVIQFTYPSGPPLDVYVHISGCRDLSASNGPRVTKINEPLVRELLSAVGYDSGFPDPRELR